MTVYKSFAPLTAFGLTLASVCYHAEHRRPSELGYVSISTPLPQDAEGVQVDWPLIGRTVAQSTASASPSLRLAWSTPT